MALSSASVPLAEVPVRAFPTLTEAARMIGVSPSTLSRRETVRASAESEGERYKRLHPFLVLREAAHFKRVSTSRVAALLQEYAEEHAPEAVEAVQQETEAFYATRGDAPRMSAAEFLAIARNNFPAPLVREIERVLAAGGVMAAPGRGAAGAPTAAGRPA